MHTPFGKTLLAAALGAIAAVFSAIPATALAAWFDEPAVKATVATPMHRI